MTGLVFQLAAAAACARCHPAVVEAHARTGHATALHRVSDHPLRDRFQGRASWGKHRYAISGKEVRIVSGPDLMVLPIEWAFGAGHQAVTFVTRVNEEAYLEHSFSYYSAPSGIALTPGHLSRRPATIADAAGLLYKTRDPEAGIDGCFGCHSTGPLTYSATSGIVPTEPGVQCEACHPGAAAHAVTGNAIAAPRLSATRLNEFCGRCHRPPASDPTRIDWDYSWNVRHQPVYLDRSACFRKSEGRLSCLTCHPAHTSVTTQPASWFNARCASCHKPSPSCRTDCADCHMPRVSPQPGLRFTNHWIGIYPGGAKLRPRQKR